MGISMKDASLSDIGEEGICAIGHEGLSKSICFARGVMSGIREYKDPFAFPESRDQSRLEVSIESNGLACAE